MKAKMNKRFRSWHKVVDILEHDGHLLFGDFKIWHGGSDEKIEYICLQKVNVTNGHFIEDVNFLCFGANACIGKHGVKRWRTIPSDLGRNCKRTWTSIRCGGFKNI